ncbi:MAG TPA: hypothetical protein VHZ07_03985 [Bryobacteraceae bacterium]|jgi:hypothetical protein|nr:hypothetical protein [Bryobacteraceae bacterium]
MVVRIRWNKIPVLAGARLRPVALGLAALLTPLSLGAFTMGFWNIAADLQWTSGFAISTGALSHWEVWLAGAAVLLLVARLLNRYGEADNAFDGGKHESPI